MHEALAKRTSTSRLPPEMWRAETERRDSRWRKLGLKLLTRLADMFDQHGAMAQIVRIPG